MCITNCIQKEDRGIVKCMIYMLIIALCVLSVGVVLVVKYKEFDYTEFKGYIVDSEINYNNVTNLYHLNMIGEKLSSKNCTYYDYAVGSINSINAIINQDMMTEIKWSKRKNSNVCVKYVENTKYNTGHTTIIISALISGFLLFLLCLAIEISLTNNSK